MTTTLCALALAVFIVQVNGEFDKRSVSALARTGQLPGKRYVAALAKNGEFPRPSWNKKYTSLEDLMDQSDDDQYTKRYLGALARTGDLRVARERNEKREDVDSLIRDIATADEMKRLRLDALRDELVKEQDGVDDDQSDEKRSMASIARGGGMPGKRSVEALARIGLLKPITSTRDFNEDDEFEKQISSEEFEDEKRGGISSLARNGYYNNKRTVDEELEELMNEVYGIGEKRNVASLAKSFSLPPSGKRSEEEEDKRNLPSLMRDRNGPLGKRDGYTNNAIPFVGNDKRNIGALAKNKDFPYAYRFGKREISEEEKDEMSKRYVATLLRDGRLPVGPDANNSNQEDSQEKDDRNSTEEDQTQIADDKEQNVRRKKEISAKDEAHARTKRETYISPINDELAGPTGDIEFAGMIAGDNKWADDTSPLNKRYFAVRGGGKMPGGRLPKVGTRSRSRHENSGRRRH